MTDTSPPDVVFRGDSLEIIREFSASAREHLGLDLRRVQNGEKPLDGGSMGAALPGVFELRDEDKDFWYRVLYVRLEGTVYVLHCFAKTTNQTSQKDINTARLRLTALELGLAAQKKLKKKK